MTVEIWQEILSRLMEAGREYNCDKFLGLIYTEKPMSTLEIFNLATPFSKVGFNLKNQFAWVQLNTTLLDDAHYAETVLHNRGLRNARLFTKKSDAVAWLEKKSPNSLRVTY